MSFYRPSSLCETLSAFYTPQGIGYLTGFPEHRPLTYCECVRSEQPGASQHAGALGRGQRKEAQWPGGWTGVWGADHRCGPSVHSGAGLPEVRVCTYSRAGWLERLGDVCASTGLLSRLLTGTQGSGCSLSGCPKRIVESKWTAALGCGCFNVMPSPAVYRCGHVSLSASTPARRGLLCHLLERAGLRSKEAAGTGGGSFLSVIV